MITRFQYDNLWLICQSEESEDDASQRLVDHVALLIAEVDESVLTFEQSGQFYMICEYYNAGKVYPGIHWLFKDLIDVDAYHKWLDDNYTPETALFMKHLDDDKYKIVLTDVRDIAAKLKS